MGKSLTASNTLLGEKLLLKYLRVHFGIEVPVIFSIKMGEVVVYFPDASLNEKLLYLLLARSFIYVLLELFWDEFMHLEGKHLKR